MHGEVGLKAQELFESWQSINNIRVMSEGIVNGGAFEKKERVVNAEVEDELSQTSIILESGLIFRKLFVETMKLTYPQYKDELNKIKVYTVNTNNESDKIKEDENKGQTDEKEE